MLSSKQIIKQLDMQPHPEGGYFKEVYRSDDTILKDGLPGRYESDRCAGTSIYYMLEGEQFSSFHKLKSDEIWHYYKGSSIIIHLISPEGEYSKVIIGDQIERGELFQFTIPNNNWFAAEVSDKSSFSLVGCTVSPGFDFDDFELGSRAELTKLFPNHKEIIAKFTR